LRAVVSGSIEDQGANLHFSPVRLVHYKYFQVKEIEKALDKNTSVAKMARGKKIGKNEGWIPSFFRD